MLLRVTTVIAALATICSADSLTLRSGRVIDGQFLGGDARQIRMAVGDRVETFAIDEVSNLQFNGGQPPARPTAERRPMRPDSDYQQPPPPPPPSSYASEIPANTQIVVRMI